MHMLVVTCGRDHELLDLLLQSLDKFCEQPFTLWIIVNDRYHKMPNVWSEILARYPHMDLRLRDRDDFDLAYMQQPRVAMRIKRWIEHETHLRRIEGWIDQQLLKFAGSQLLPPEVDRYLILDSQNFLIRPWQAPDTEKTPYRTGLWSMDDQVWQRYQRHFRLQKKPPQQEQSFCTPIWADRRVLDRMFQERHGVRNWSQWFVAHGERFCSEFLCLWAYARSRNLWKERYEPVPDWARCYLRDSDQFDQDFEKFLRDLDLEVPNQCWSSINHRSWQIMNNEQLAQIKAKLKNLGFEVSMDYVREQWPEQEVPEPPLSINTL